MSFSQGGGTRLRLRPDKAKRAFGREKKGGQNDEGGVKKS